MRPSVEALKREASDIELQIRQLQVKDLLVYIIEKQLTKFLAFIAGHHRNVNPYTNSGT